MRVSKMRQRRRNKALIKEIELPRIGEPISVEDIPACMNLWGVVFFEGMRSFCNNGFRKDIYPYSAAGVFCRDFILVMELAGISLENALKLFKQVEREGLSVNIKTIMSEFTRSKEQREYQRKYQGKKRATAVMLPSGERISREERKGFGGGVSYPQLARSVPEAL